MIRKFGKYKVGDVDIKEVPPRGINTLVPKDIFVEGAYARNWAGLEDFGRSLGRIEGTRILTHISDHFRGRCVRFSFDDFVDKMDDVVDKMGSLGYEPNVIIAQNGEIVRKMSESSDFLPQWKQKGQDIPISGYKGTYRNVPVFLYPFWTNNSVLVCDLRKLGVLHQYYAKEEGPLKFEIRVIDKSTARQHFDEKPEPLKDEEGRMRSMEKAVHDLQKNVHLLILEKFEYNVEDDNAVVLLMVS